MTPKKGDGKRAEIADCLADWAKGLNTQRSSVVERALHTLEGRSYDRGVMERLARHMAEFRDVRGLYVGTIVCDGRYEAGRDEREQHTLARLAWYGLRKRLEDELAKSPLLFVQSERLAG